MHCFAELGACCLQRLHRHGITPVCANWKV